MTPIQSISITWFENPHTFWYTKSHLKHEDFVEFDCRLQTYIGKKTADKNTESEYVFGEDTIVAIYDKIIKKWIRVVIKEILDGNEFKLWAIDYGFYLKCKNLNDLIELTNDFCKPLFNRIFLGGIYGVISNENAHAKLGDWPSKTVTQIRGVLCDANQFLFKARIKNDRQLFGDLWIVKVDKSVFNLREYLIQSNLAKNRQDFANDVSDLEISDAETPKKQIPTYLNIPKVPKITITLDENKRQISWPNAQNRQLTKSHESNKNGYNGTRSNGNTPYKGINTVKNTPSKSISSIQEVTKNVNKMELYKIRENSIQNKIELSTILVHSDLKLRPIESKLDAIFGREIHAALRPYTELYAAQSYAWPHLARYNSLIIVDGPSSGKTMAYVPAVCSLVQEDSLSSTNRSSSPSASPSVIVISPTKQFIEKIAYRFREFLGSVRLPRSELVVEGSKDVHSTMDAIYNGCIVFVCTPRMFTELLAHNPLILRDMDKIRHVILDNFTLKFNKFRDEYNKIYTWLKRFESIQTIVTARTWSSCLRELSTHLQNPMLIIGNFIDAYFYGKAAIETVFVADSDKNANIVKYLSQNNEYLTEKTIIICNTNESVHELSQLLNENDIENGTITNEQPPNTCANMATKWILQSGQYFVLICTDDILRDLNIRCAQTIIHFALPERLTAFAFRFSTSLNCIHNYISHKPKPPTMQLKSLIFINEHNNEQLPKLIEYLNRYCPNQVPEQILKLSERVRNARDCSDRVPIYKPLCPIFVTTGQMECDKKCVLRHWLSPEDAAPIEFPLKGLMKVHIFNIHSPTHYTVRLMEYRDTIKNQWVTINRSNEYVVFGLEFNMECQDADNFDKIDPATIQVGDLCIAYINGKPQRCQVLKKHDARPGQRLEAVEYDLKAIDNGMLPRIKQCDLRQLPPKYHDFPGQAIDLHLIGIIPQEAIWDKDSLDKVRKDLSLSPTSPQNKQSVEANVVVALKNALVVDCIRVVEKAPSLPNEIQVASVKQTLRREKFGIKDLSAWTKFEAIVKDIGLDMKQQPKQNQSIDETEGSSEN